MGPDEMISTGWQARAGAIIVEVRRQFRDIPGLMEGTAEADSMKCIEISTQASVEEVSELRHNLVLCMVSCCVAKN